MTSIATPVSGTSAKVSLKKLKPSNPTNRSLIGDMLMHPTVYQKVDRIELIDGTALVPWRGCRWLVNSGELCVETRDGKRVAFNMKDIREVVLK